MKKTISVIIALIMFIVSVGFMPNETATTQQEQEVVRLQSVDELRETNSDTYLLSDGSYECVVYAEDKYYKDDCGKFVEIDNTIINAERSEIWGEYAYRNSSSDTVFSFSETNPSIMVEAAGRRLAFELNCECNSTAVLGGINEYNGLFDYPLSGDCSIAYPDVLESTDIVYTAANGILKEFIVLKDASASGEYSFSFKTDGCIAQMSKDGTVEFLDKYGDRVFELSKLFAVDAAGAYTDELYYSIVSSGESSAEILVHLPLEYLTDADRVFPVVIDPSVTITGSSVTYDSFVSSANPSTNYQMSTSLRTGKDEPYGKRRTYIKFNIPSSVYGKITTAYIKIKKNSGATPNVRAYRVISDWSSGTVTWNNRPGFDSNTASSVSTLISNDWYRLDVQDIVFDWVHGIYNNYGFLLKDASEGSTSHWTTFYSSDAASPNKPELHITYCYFNHTVDSYYDYGFPVYYNLSTAVCESKISSYVSTVNSRYQQLFGLQLIMNSPTYYSSSPIDICKGTVTSSNINTLCSHSGTIHTDRPNVISAFKSAHPGNASKTTVLWSSHRIEYIMTNGDTDHNRSCSSGKSIFIIEQYDFGYEPYLKAVLMHELNHQFGGRDHYHDPDSNGNCRNYAICSRCHEDSPNPRPTTCIMFRVENQDLNSDEILCDDCKAEILAYLKSTH